MKLLAWDTSSKVGALAALEWDQNQGRDGIRLVSEWSLNVDATHSERLLWAIHELLESARWKLSEIDLFGVGVGPGSFTGLRIGLTTARTLAHTLGKPLIGVSSLATLARPAATWLTAQKIRAVVVAATDACKGELFALVGAAPAVLDCVVAAEGERTGLWKRGVSESVLTPDDLLKALRRKLTEGGKAHSQSTLWLAIGEGRGCYPELWQKLPSEQELIPPVPFMNHVQGRYLGLLVWEAYQAGLTLNALEVYPRYLRASDAELKLRRGD